MFCRCCTAGLTASIVLTSQLAMALNQFVFDPQPGTGNFTLVPNGSFEVGDLSGWTNNVPARGVFTASTNDPFVGSWSAMASPNMTFTGPGYDAITGPIFVIPGETYVLSGFFDSQNLPHSSLYLNFNYL